MFRDVISETPFVTNEVNDVFHVYGDDIGGDNTMLSTLRALIEPRITDGATFRLRYYQYSRSTTDFIDPWFDDANLVVSTVMRRVGADNWSEKVRKFFERDDIKTKWIRADRIIKWLSSNKFDVDVYINNEQQKTFVFMPTLDIKAVHILEGIISTLLPWYFESQPLTEEEKELILSLGEKTPTKYMSMLEKMVGKYNFRESKIRKYLAGFEQFGDKIALQTYEGDMQTRRSIINDYQDKIARELKELNDIMIRIAGIQARLENAKENELMEFFIGRDDVDIIDASQTGNLRFIAKGYCSTYDPEKAEIAIKNKRSVFYESCNDSFTSSDMEKLLNAVFVEEKIKLRFCAAYSFRIHGGPRVDGLAGWNYPPSCREYMPNPHIHFYRCIGDYVPYIVKFLAAGNYIGAIEQVIESMKSLNFTDPPVMRNFGSWIVEHRNSAYVFELPDGTSATAIEAIKYLKKEEANV